ncbi:DUF2399 domain-containing protein [Psychrobacter sp. APC 3281]|uniref:DUF7281 domain-containing protein n=1 Tax=unclassified Psychrobacter TaxID=196806 RepID=UPI0025B3BCB6|nr:DUF2399 domain-containing protein [Psychrobacter sp. APC 3281]MDN3447804.1 DUF2399 domain-containing protein [Psychrobacter sp. APC 3281]|tara:strand:+ start:26854 stop:27765 length:912 start_codon:yes stop_codon:yes gene_type:complete
MEVDLEKSLNKAGKLDYLKEKMILGVKFATYRSPDNILVLLVSFDPSIGYTENGKVIINMGGWGRIREIVKAQTGIDLLRHNLNELKSKDRVDNTAITTNDKLLSKAPTKGFLECRLLGSEEHIINVSNNYTHKQTQENAYLGVEINDLIDWNIDNIIIIENFNAFCRFNEQHAKLVKGLTGAVTVLAYRGHNNKNITSILKALAQKDCKRYIFADYDLAGLKIAESMSKTLKAHGYILPNKPWMQTEKYIEMSVKENRKKQSSIQTSLPSLTPYFEHIRDKYLAVPQETLMARKIPLKIIDI